MTQMGRYPSQTIELQVENVAQLFDRMDPFPFRERDLDVRAEQYILGWARDAPSHGNLSIVIHLPATAVESSEAQHVSEAFGRHFDYCVERTSQDLRQLFRQGRYAIASGAGVLTFALLLRQFVLAMLPNEATANIIAESLLIMGWVANWKPLEIFLYDWWPLVQTRRLFRRLSAAPVLLRPKS